MRSNSFAGPLQMCAWAIGACLVRHVGDVQISRPRARGCGGCLDDHAAPHILNAVGIGELQAMDPAVHAIDDQIDLLAHLIAGQLTEPVIGCVIGKGLAGDEMDWRSLLHPSARAQLSSAANCARRKYRLTPDGVDRRSNRRRFSDERKRAIVQETETPGVSVAQVCRRHGIATSMIFRWRVEFGLSARQAPQLATVEFAEGAANEPPALAALRNLVRPPDGMMAMELDDGRRVFAPAGSSPAEVKRQLAKQPARKGKAS